MLTKKITQVLPKLEYKKLLTAFSLQKTRAVVNPFQPAQERVRQKGPANIFIYHYNQEKLETEKPSTVEGCYTYPDKHTIAWINVDGLDNAEIEKLSTHFGIHPLLQEDILSYGQRPKMDEIDNVLYVLLNMLFVDEHNGVIDQEQISIVLGDRFILSFQEDATRDVFDPVRAKLAIANSKIRQTPADYLFYSLIDVIVDSYYMVIEKMGSQIEKVEEEILHRASPNAFAKINQLRKDIILLKRNTAPVRDLVGAIIRSESELLNDRTTKYFKDVYDHIVQVNDLCDNYRDLVMSLQDLYMNNVNLRMNEVMKTLAIITAVMAPATVIGGIFGMNFEIVPYIHHQWGFYGTIIAMIVIPIIMIWYFQKRGWFQRELPAQPKPEN